MSLHRTDIRPGSVVDIDQRPPQVRIMYDDPSVSERRLDHCVHHEVESHSRAPTYDGPLTQDDRQEAVVCETGQHPLGHQLRNRVRKWRLGRMFFVEWAAIVNAVDGASRTE